LIALVLAASTLIAQGFSALVIGVADGDTISVLRDGRPITIRLDGIDCPEGGQDFSQRAKALTSQMAFGKSVTVGPKELDKYGRLVARVIADGQDVSLALVQAGLAWHYKQYSSDQSLAAAEVAARRAGIGLWSVKSPMPPWEFRHPSSSLVSRGPAGPYHGNVSTRVFHRPGCQHYNCKNCTAVFKTRDEAITAGYRPGGCCKP
jgi:endonuclease YncB( thermonuclease family)